MKRVLCSFGAGCCRCLAFVGLLLMLPGVAVQATPVPATYCISFCREHTGPHQLLQPGPNDPTDCWKYEDPVCNNCQKSSTESWGCYWGTVDETKPACVQKTELQVVNGVVIRVPSVTNKIILNPGPNETSACDKLCDQYDGLPTGLQRTKRATATDGVKKTTAWYICEAAPPP